MHKHVNFNYPIECDFLPPKLICPVCVHPAYSYFITIYYVPHPV